MNNLKVALIHSFDGINIVHMNTQSKQTNVRNGFNIVDCAQVFIQFEEFAIQYKNPIKKREHECNKVCTTASIVRTESYSKYSSIDEIVLFLSQSN